MSYRAYLGRLAAVAACATFALCPPRAHAQASVDAGLATVVKAGNVWDGKADKALGPMEILVRKGRIVALGKTVEHPAGARIIDLAGHTVTPGFIDCHVHVTMRPDVVPKAWSLTGSDKALLGVQALRILLDHGFTTVRDLADLDLMGFTTVSLRKGLDKGLFPGPRLIVAGHFVSSRGGHGDGEPLLSTEVKEGQFGLADGVEEIHKTVRTEVARGAQWIKFGATGGFMTPADDPSQVPYSQLEMNEIVQTARDLGVPVTPHAYGDEGIRRAVLAGVRGIEHGNMASPATLKLIEERGVYIVPTLMAVLEDARHASDDSYWNARGEGPWVQKKYRKRSTRCTFSTSPGCGRMRPLSCGGGDPCWQRWRRAQETSSGDGTLCAGGRAG